MKSADPDKRGTIGINTYNNKREDLSEAFLEYIKNKKSPLLEEFTKSKKNYYEEIILL